MSKQRNTRKLLRGVLIECLPEKEIVKTEYNHWKFRLLENQSGKAYHHLSEPYGSVIWDLSERVTALEEISQLAKSLAEKVLYEDDEDIEDEAHNVLQLISRNRALGIVE